MQFLIDRGWEKLTSDVETLPQSERWSLGHEPFLVELELWSTGEVRGRLVAPSSDIYGSMVFTSLKSVPDAVEFLERLLKGALDAWPIGGASIFRSSEDKRDGTR